MKLCQLLISGDRLLLANVDYLIFPHLFNFLYIL